MRGVDFVDLVYYNIIMIKIPYFQTVNHSIAAGAQPKPQDIQDLHSHGYNVILNISPTNTRNYLPEEEQLAKDLGMDYHHLPIDCSNLQAQQYHDFEQILDATLSKPNAKVFIHCGMNIKSSGMLHIYRTQKLGQSKEEAAKALLETPGHEPKWTKYWANWGV